MRYRKQDENGDYAFGNQGADFYVDSQEAVAQAVQTRLLLNQGEWFLDTTEGTPYSTQILDKYTATKYDAAIRQRILGTQGVSELVSYLSTVDPDARSLSVTATINTIYGTTTVQATL